MTEPVFFRNIPMQVPHEAVYRRLGYRAAITQVSEEQRRRIENAIAEAAGMAAVQGVLRIMDIAHRDPGYVTLDSQDRLVSNDLISFLGGCGQVVLLGATAGNAVMTAIQDATAAENISAAVVYDAVASEMADSALDWLMRYADTQLRRQDRYLMRKRFSCGYGDFSLSHQRLLYELLRLESLGVSINGQYILSPEKTVTAVTGVMDVPGS